MVFGIALLVFGIINAVLGLIIGYRHGAWVEWARHQPSPEAGP